MSAAGATMLDDRVLPMRQLAPAIALYTIYLYFQVYKVYFYWNPSRGFPVMYRLSPTPTWLLSKPRLINNEWRSQ